MLLFIAMSFLARFGVAAALFFSSIFGVVFHSNTPLSPTSQAASSTISLVSHVSFSAGDTPRTPFSEIANTQTVEIVNNDLFMDGVLVVHNIPGTLGLKPSSLGEAPTHNSNGFSVGKNGFLDYLSYWPSGQDSVTGTADIYGGLATSTSGNLAAFLYERAGDGNDASSPTVSFASVLVFSPSGLKYRLDLNNQTSPSPSQSDVYYVDATQVYLAENVGKDTSSTKLYRILFSDNTLSKVAEFGPSETRSPDKTKVAFTSVPAGTPEIRAGCGTMGDEAVNEVDILELLSGTVKPVTNNASLPHYPIDWSQDGTSLFVADGALSLTDSTCLAHFSNFFVYDSTTGAKTYNTNPDPSVGLAMMCERTAYNCVRPPTFFKEQ